MIEIFCDGGSRGNPGQAAYGFVVKKDGKIIKKQAGTIGIATNNFAEYTALIEALEFLAKNFAGQDLKFNLDSKLIVSQLNGLYKVKSASIRELFIRVRTLEPIFDRIIYNHVPRGQNKEADRLVNLALDQKWN